MDFSRDFQASLESRSVDRGLSWRPPSTGQAPLAALRGSLGLVVQLSCVTDVSVSRDVGRAVCLDCIKVNVYVYVYV